MATKQPLKTTFDVGRVIGPLFTGGSFAIDNGISILATTLGEDVVLTNPSNGENIAKIEGDGELVSTMTLTPSGSHLIVCSRSLSMKIYAIQKSEDDGSFELTLVRTVKPHSTPIVVLAVDRTSTLLATGGTDGVIKVWDIAGGYVTHTFRGPSVLVSALRFFEVAGRADVGGKKGKKSKKQGAPAAGDQDEEDDSDATVNFRLATGFQDGKVRVWDLHRRSCIANLDSHVADVQAIDFSPTQQALVSASRDKTLIWWDTRSWKIRKIVPCLEMVETAGFIDDGRLTYSGGERGYLRIWDTELGRELTSQQDTRGESDALVGSIYRPDLPFIVCAQMDHTLALYHPPSKDDTTASAAQEPFRRISGTHDDIIDLAYLTPQRNVMALATNAEEIRIVSTVEPESLTTPGSSWLSGGVATFGQDVGLLKGHDDIVITLDTDWSGYWVATGAKDNSARLWKVDPSTDTYECYAVFTGHAESVGAVGLPKTIPQETSQAFKDPLNTPPPYLITGSQDQTIKNPRKDINAVDMHPMGHLFASASQDKTVKIWSVEEGEVQGILRGHKRGVWSVRFAPSGLPALQGEEGSVAGKGVVLTGSGDKTVKLWNLADYSCIRTFEGHSNSVLKVAWLNVPAKEEQQHRPILVASAGGDGLVKVWNANTGEAECTLDNHEDRVWALAVHPGTNTLVSGSGDSTVTFWRDTSTESRAAATQAAQHLIEQEQELENHIHAGSYREAITLALQLNHPGRLLHLFTRVVTTDKPDAGSLSGVAAVDQVLASLSDEQIFLLLLRLRDWNANARTAPVAQRILSTLMRSYPALKEVLHALRVYTERHYKRMEELVDESYLVEYTLQEMDDLAPSMDVEVVMTDA
ncbi:unnamed protein product [Parascedosporium putredinis]|uniref:U3 small nucleolar RNA-associated protein 13 C-terminal domain-containing protein n=1 Tax=Parascedosporium putredinis TaxID=1442378 RepID=A0A9P1H0Q5_9PEZI|nr:unnamed protein product [Parascedosporium putredinis]CAI7992930.1 unnamed protein product [Parascedosporium putredinis]